MSARTPEGEEYERRSAEALDRLRPMLTPQFLETLALAARTYGWSYDYHEVRDFVEGIFDDAGQPRPELEPFEYATPKEPGPPAKIIVRTSPATIERRCPHCHAYLGIPGKPLRSRATMTKDAEVTGNAHWHCPECGGSWLA